MNRYVAEALNYLNANVEDYLEHYGIKRRSGRYPWGSGENPYQHGVDFIGKIESLIKEGWKETPENILKDFGMTSKEYLSAKGKALVDRRLLEKQKALSISQDGLGPREISDALNITESKARSLVNYEKNVDFLDRIDELKGTGWEETPENIKKEFGLTTGEYRIRKGIADKEIRIFEYGLATELKEIGLGPTEIGKILDYGESTVRSLLKDDSAEKMFAAHTAADFIRKQVDERGFIDVGGSTCIDLGISKEKMDQALSILKTEGYPVYDGRFPQPTNPGKFTTMHVICPPGTEHKEIFDLRNHHIGSLVEYASHDGGETFHKLEYPQSISSNRVKVLLKNEKGLDGVPGIERDGLLFIRRGVEDLSLGNNHYAQVRILVDGDKYLKGMAVYSDLIPDGYDIVFNSNKTSVEKAYKPISLDDPMNPFGSTIKANGQSHYIGKDGKEHLSAINMRADEGDWDEWKDALPAQFLSKQSTTLAKRQLGIAIKNKQEEYDSIMAINNPTIKKYYLNKFADECDSASVELKAAAIPGQKYHVIVPVTSLKDDEIYAPKYQDGTKLALVRYPHGGTFEIPILVVNNTNKEGSKIIGKDARDAVGINHKVAERLSGADFDGDTVMCIPTNDSRGRVKITSTHPLKGLEGFDPDIYTIPDGDTKTKRLSKKQTQREMGIVTNLINDMTILGASDDELAAAVRHSMVVIDAHKHNYDYKRSEKDNHIQELKDTYQEGGGASTLISLAKNTERVTKRQGSPKVNLKGTKDYDPSRPEGALIWKDAKDAYYTKRDPRTGGDKIDPRTGKPIIKRRTVEVTRMSNTDDARTLISKQDTDIENLYADYANSMKSMANKSRKEAMLTPNMKMNPEAKKTYSKQVESLNKKVEIAERNRPKERQATIRANEELLQIEDNIRTNNPGISNSEVRSMLKKPAQRAMNKYRDEVGSVKRSERSIEIEDDEWEAIQAGAVSSNTLNKILNNSNPDSLRQRATPKQTVTVSDSQTARIKAMQANGYTIAEIADRLGLSPSTVSNHIQD